MVIDNYFIISVIFTAHIRGMGEGNSFSLFVSPHLGEGVLHPSPSHTSTRTISFLRGIPHLHPIILPLAPCPFWGGYPSDWYQVLSWGYPSPRWGYCSTGTPPPPPGIGQQRKYLLHSGRYASCVHAEGLSCQLYDQWYRFWSRERDGEKETRRRGGPGVRGEDEKKRRWKKKEGTGSLGERTTCSTAAWRSE